MEKHENDYYWKLHFKDGSTLTRKEWLAIAKSSRIDPNKPPQATTMVQLLSDDSSKLPIEIAIPEGALPVVAREQKRNEFSKLSNIIFKIGFNVNKVRYMVCVNIADNKIYNIIDEGGCS